MSTATVVHARTRRAPRAVASWLGLPLVVLTSTAPAAAQAQPPATTTTTTPTAGEVMAVDTAAVEKVLAELDALYGRGDVAGYLGRFAPDHPGAHAVLRRQLERCVAASGTRQRVSTLVGEPRVVGPRTVVRVRHEVHLSHGGKAGGPGANFADESLLVLQRTADGKATPTLSVEINPDHPAADSDHFRCPACNYEIGATPGWLCVPLRSDRARAMEAATFYLLGTDIACDVSVQIDPSERDARTVVQELADTLRRLEPGSRLAVAESWVPPSLAGEATTALSGARLAVELPGDFPTAGGGRAILHVTAFGGLQHVLLVRGCANSLRDRQADVEALLASYRLIEVDCDLATAAARPLEHHTGGILEGGAYTNSHYGVEMQGPEGWRAEQRCGGAAFKVAWSSPDGSRLWLIGNRVPPGMRRWCQTTADRWLEHMCVQHGLKVAPPDPGSAWTATEGGVSIRTVVATPLRPPVPGAPRRRWIRLQLHDDLLLVADGFATTSDDDTALQSALAGLRRN